MPACCERPDPIFLGNGHRWCRSCHRDLDEPHAVVPEQRPIPAFAGTAHVPHPDWCVVVEAHSREDCRPA